MSPLFRHKGGAHPPPNKRTAEFYGLIGLVLLGFMFWGARSLWDSSEARYGQVAFEMIRSGHWLVPTLAGEPHLTKPPFTYWMAAAGMKLFGLNAWGARFFLAVFFTGTLFSVRELGRAMGYDRKVALSAALIFATAIVPFIGGHTLTSDAFLTFWETLGILAAWKVWQNPARRPDGWRLVFWAAFGMGFFTKGPPALLPLVAIAVFVWMRRGQGRGAALVSLPGIVLFMGLSFWWFAVLVVHNPALIHYFIGDEVIGRIATDMYHRSDPFWIYAPIIIFGVGPWLLLWPRLMVRIYGRFRHKTLWAEDRYLFLLLWFTMPLAVFVLAKSRMPLYVMPLFAPLSLTLAHTWCTDVGPRLRRSKPKWRAVVAGLAVWCLALAVFTVYPDRFPGARSYRPAAETFNQALARIPEPVQLFWVYAGRQKYSIPFYMQRVIGNAEGFDRYMAERSSPGVKVPGRVLYITKAIVLSKLQHQSHRPVVIAQTPNLALIEWPPSGSPPKETARVQATHGNPAGGSDTLGHKIITSHPFRRYAALWLLLAGRLH